MKGRVTLSPLAVASAVDVDASEAACAAGFHGDTIAARSMFEQTRDFLAANPRPDPWGSYLVRDGAQVVGSCAFKHAPLDDGSVEIAYFIFPAFEGRGYATATISALCEIARGKDEARLVLANTLPEENASNMALRRNGFAFVGETVDPEDGIVWRWELIPRDLLSRG